MTKGLMEKTRVEAEDSKQLPLNWEMLKNKKIKKEKEINRIFTASLKRHIQLKNVIFSL